MEDHKEIRDTLDRKVLTGWIVKQAGGGQEMEVMLSGLGVVSLRVMAWKQAGYTQAEIARKMGKSQGRISHILQKALNYIKKRVII